MTADVEQAVSAIRRGQVAILPTDTVYGLCAGPYQEDHVQPIYRLKGRDESQPIAMLFSDVDVMFDCVPELRGRSGVIARALLPGPFTLVLANPARRFPWLTGSRPETIGVRVPDLPPPAQRVLDSVGAVAATSANRAGGPDPRRLEDVPEEIRAASAAEVDAGELPGTPSTVIDFTAEEPRVLREGAAPADEALAQVRAALA